MHPLLLLLAASAVLTAAERILGPVPVVTSGTSPVARYPLPSNWPVEGWPLNGLTSVDATFTTAAAGGGSSPTSGGGTAGAGRGAGAVAGLL